MENHELVEKVLLSFDHEAVWRVMKACGATWTSRRDPKKVRVPDAQEIREEARRLLLDLLHDPPETASIESGGLMVIRRGSRVGIGFVPVHSDEFP